LSLTIVYRDRFVRFSELGVYGLKRFLRIAPVLRLPTSWQLFVYWQLNRSGKVVIPVDAADVLMNDPLMFGFLKPSQYLASGAWSIGNELAFYAIFPLLILLVRRGRWAVTGLLAANVGIFGWWCLKNYSSELTLTTHWRDYVQPLNPLFYFVSGVLLGILLRPGLGRRMWGVGLEGLIAALIVLPASGDLMQIVQGLNRLLFSGIAVAVVMAVYLWNPSSEGRLAKMLGFLGEISYSLYLYHPLVHQPAVRFGRNIGLSSEWACWVAAVPMSVGLAALSYRFLEKPVMAWANRLTSRRNIPGRETEPSRSNDRSEMSVGESRQAA